jgi:hypothetical protein
VVSTAAPVRDALQDGLRARLSEARLKDETASGIARLITGATAAGVGSVLSGGDLAGTGQAFNVDSNNRQLHEAEIQLIKLRYRQPLVQHADDGEVLVVRLDGATHAG